MGAFLSYLDWDSADSSKYVGKPVNSKKIHDILHFDRDKSAPTLGYKKNAVLSQQILTITPDTTFVLWIRHCNSCANEAGKLYYIRARGVRALTDKLFRQTLCTKLGIEQAMKAGTEIRNTNLPRLFNSGIDFYSSVLPRAVQTAVIVARKTILKGPKITVQRIPYIIEHAHGYNHMVGNRGSQSSLTYEKSNDYAKAIQCVFGDKRVIVADNVSGIDYVPNKVFISDGEDDYDKFLKEILPTFKKGPKLNVVVGHGGFIRTNVLGGIMKDLSDFKLYHPDNLDGFLIAYNPTYPKGVIVKLKKDNLITITKKDITTACMSLKYSKDVNKLSNSQRDNENKRACLKGMTTIKTDMFNPEDVADIVPSSLVSANAEKFVTCEYTSSNYKNVKCKK